MDCWFQCRQCTAQQVQRSEGRTCILHLLWQQHASWTAADPYHVIHGQTPPALRHLSLLCVCELADFERRSCQASSLDGRAKRRSPISQSWSYYYSPYEWLGTATHSAHACAGTQIPLNHFTNLSVCLIELQIGSQIILTGGRSKMNTLGKTFSGKHLTSQLRHTRQRVAGERKPHTAGMQALCKHRQASHFSFRLLTVHCTSCSFVPPHKRNSTVLECLRELRANLHSVHKNRLARAI